MPSQNIYSFYIYSFTVDLVGSVLMSCVESVFSRQLVSKLDFFLYCKLELLYTVLQNPLRPDYELMQVMLS